MFEGIVSSVLVKVLGDYIENLDSNSLNIGILSGKVELRNLFLKSTALDAFDLPVTVVKGTVGLINADIPWKSLGSSPVIARVSDVYLVVQPRKCNAWNSDAEAQRFAASQRSKITAYEAQLKAEKDKKELEEASGEKKSDDGFVARLTETVINNLQVHINNVHIRYEDSSDPDPANAVIFGLTLKSLSAVSCDENWAHAFIKKAGKEMRKKVELKQFCVYMANYTNEKSLAMVSTITSSSKAFQEIMSQLMNQMKDKETHKDVLIDHVDGTLKLIIQKDGEGLDLTKPKIAADLEVEDVNVSLHQTQYRSVLRTLDYVSNFQKLERYRRWKPTVRPAQEPLPTESPIDHSKVRREWWKFALAAGKDQINDRYFSWDQVNKRKKQREDYIFLYKKKKLDKASQEKKKKLEVDMDTKLLIFARELAEGELKLIAENKKKSGTKVEQKPNTSSGWFGGWLGGGEKKDETEEDDSKYTLTDEQRKFLHTTIGYDAQAKADRAKLPNDYEKLKVRFILRGGVISLNDDKQTIVSADYHNLTADVVMREAVGNVIVSVGLQSFNIVDRYCKETKYASILYKRTSKSVTTPDSDKLVDIRVETAPLHGNSDLEVSLVLGKTDVVINTVLLQKIFSFFIIPSTVNLLFVQQAAKKGLDSIQQQALTQLRVALEDKKVLDISVQIKAPRFIIPKDCNDATSELIVIDLGKFHIKSDIDKEARKKRIKEQSVEEKDFYDRFDFELKDVQVVIVPNQELINNKEEISKDPLLHNVTMGMQLSKCITSHPTYPGIKVTGTVPKIKLVLSPKKFDTILFAVSKILDLVDNPTGTSSAKLAMGGKLNVKQIVSEKKLLDIKDAAISDKFKEYDVELRQDGNLFFYDTNPLVITNRRKPVACLSLSTHIIKLLDGVDFQKEGVSSQDLVLRLPQPDGDDVFVVLNSEESQKLEWKSKISNILLSYATYDLVKSHISTDVVVVDHSNKPNLTILKLNLVLEEFALLINFADPTSKDTISERPLAQLDLHHLTVDLTVRTFDQQLCITLKTLGIEYLPRQIEETSKYILHSAGNEESDAVAELKLTLCSDDRSEHYSLNADTTISLKFATFKLFFDPLAISKFVLFGYSLADVMHDNSSKNFRMFTLSSGLPDVEKQLHEIQARTSERSSLGIDTRMHEISLILRDSGTTFASASMRETSISFKSSDSGMHVSGDIGNLVAEDKGGDIISDYSEILGLGRVGSSVMKFSFEQNKESSNDLQYGKMLTIVMESVKFVYLNRFISKIQLYFADGPLMDAIKEGGKRIKDITTDVMKKQTTTIAAADMLGLDLTFETPIVKVPVSCSSRDHIHAELGKIRVFNVLSRPTSSSLVEDIRIELHNMNMETKLFGSIRQVVESVEINMSVKRVIFCEEVDTPNIDFDMLVSEVAMKLSHAQYQMIFRIIDNNINDSIAGPTKGQPQKALELPSFTDEGDSLSVIEKLKSKVTVKFPHLNLTLYRGAGGIENEDAIARLNMRDLFVLVRAFEGRSTTKVKLHEVDALDMRNDSLSQFKKFIDSAGANTDFIEVDIETKSTADADRLLVDVKMGDPRLVFEPQIVAEIQNFFTSMRPDDKEASSAITNNVKGVHSEEKGDLHFSTNTWLGNGITISNDRKLYIDANQSGEVILEGEGNTIKLVTNPNDTTRLIFIAKGMKLRLRNVVLMIPDNEQIDNLIELQDSSSVFTAPSTLGVFREHYNPLLSELDLASVSDVVAVEVKKKQVQEIRVKLGHPSVVFPVDATLQDTNLFVVKAELDLRMVFTEANRTIEIGVRELTAYTESAANRKIGAPIVEPINLSIKMSEDFANHKRLINASIKGVLRIRLAYQDVKMITQVVNAFKQTSELSAELAKGKIEIEHEKTEDSASDEMSGSDDEDDDQFEEVEEAPSSPVSVIATPSESVPSEVDKPMDITGQFSLDKFGHRYQVNTTSDLSSLEEDAVPEKQEIEMCQEFNIDPDQQISILIVDDLKGYDVPLLNFVLSEVTLKKASIEGSRMAFKVSFCIHALYYNMGLADWEPIIEPWRALVDFQRKMSCNPKTPLKTIDEIHVKDIAKNDLCQVEEPTGVPLNFNFTQSMIHSLITTSQLWKDEFSGKSVSKKVEPYLIRNHSGFSIQMTRGGYEPISLQPRKEQGFNFEKEQLDIGGEEIVIMFSEIQLFKKLIINVRKTGLSPFSTKDGSLFGVVDVELNEGRKLITVRSGIKVKNDSTKTWLIGSGDLNTQNLLVFGEIKPGQDVGVPMNVVQSGSLCIRPKDSKTESPYWWSDAMPGFKFTELMLMENRSRPVECKQKLSKSDNLDVFCAVIRPVFTKPMTNELERATKDQKANAHRLQSRNCIIEIRAPLCVENLLGCDIMVSVREKDKLDSNESKALHQSEHKLVKMGKKIHLYRASMRSHILLKAFPANQGVWTSRTSALIYLNPAAMSTSKERIPVASQWQLYDEKRRPLKIHFDYSRSQGTAFREVMLYVPYWIMNHTQQPLMIRELNDVSAGQEQTKTDKNESLQSTSIVTPKVVEDDDKVEQYQKDLLMFSFNSDTTEEQAKQRIAIKVNDTQNSEFFRIEKVGVGGNLSLHSKTMRYTIGFHTSLCPGKFNRSKLVTFYSRYLIANKTEKDLVFRQENKKGEYTIKKDERMPYYWSELDVRDPRLQLNIAHSDLQWSASFPLNTLDEMSIKLNGVAPRINEASTPSGHILSVNVTEQQGCILVTIKEPSEPPYLIDNELECGITINQLGSTQQWKIPTSSKVAYAWDSLSGKQKLCFQLLNCLPKELDINEVTQKPIILLIQNTKDRSQSRSVKITVSAEGPTRVVRISDAVAVEVEKDKKKVEEELYFFLDTKLSGVGLSLIDNYPKEICYVSVSDIRFRQSSSESSMYVEFKCLGVQIDNMLRETPFPVAFAPVNKHTYHESLHDNSLSKPFLHFSMCKSLKESNDSINLFRYLSFNLQEATIEIDYTFIEHVINLVDELTAEDHSNRADAVESVTDKDIVAVTDMLKVVVDHSAESHQKFYFEDFELHPVRLNLTFKFTQAGQGESESDAQSLKGRLYNMMKSLGFLTNIDDAPICLNALLLKHPLLTREALQDRIKKHYTRCGTYELYKIVGSLELIGNPVGLFNDLTTGVKDLFYEPASALTRSPEEFSRGLAKGSLSLLSHSIHGTFNTASKITGTIGKGVSMLTLDDNYVKQRERSSARKARGVKEGLIDGTEALAKGILEGATGVFTQPVKGARSEGFFGIMKGIGKGIIGIPTKPISGIVDFASKATEGISNIGTVHNERKRKTRTFRNDGLLIQYSEQDAFAAELMHDVNEGSYIHKSHEVTIQTNTEPERAIFYMPNRDDSCVFLITNRNILKIKLSNKSIQWIVDVKKIKAVKSGQNDEIIITYQDGSKDAERKMFYKDPNYRLRFKEQLLSVQQAQYGK